jgi:mannose-6-phosphate isomerase-like protein (cupin superfamily)
MAVIHTPTEPTHDLGNTKFKALVSPTRGACETSVWEVEIAAGTEPTPHSLTREEVFVVLSGTAAVRIDGADEFAITGDAIVIPASVRFELTNSGSTPLRLLCCLPVGGQAVTDDGASFTPPWSE